MRRAYNRAEMLAQSILEDTEARLVRMFALRACWFEPFPFDAQLPRIEPGRIVLPGAEPGVEPWSCDKGGELPVRSNGLPVGRFVLVPATPTTGVVFSHVVRAEAIAMVDVVGQGIGAALLAETSA
ncbi:MAG TPA: hypothetical protein VEZ15_02860 [Acidimicrobiia bacterium]|nr:hypothetical protein [Acidimicrobiia bacterium]